MNICIFSHVQNEIKDSGDGETSGGGSGEKQVGAGSSTKGKASTKKGVKSKRSRHSDDDDNDDDCVIVDPPAKSRKTGVCHYTSTGPCYFRRLISGRHFIYQIYRFSYVVLEYHFCVCYTSFKYLLLFFRHRRNAKTVYPILELINDLYFTDLLLLFPQLSIDTTFTRSVYSMPTIY